MAWVKSEYAGEFAVVSTWLLALLPWGASFFQVRGISVVSVRFLLFRVQYVLGASLEGERPFLWTWQVPGFEGTPELTFTAQVALVAALAYLVPLAVSLLYYTDESRVEAWPIDPVRLLGWLLGVVSLLVTVSALLLVRHHAGVVVPLAPPFAVALSYLLVTVDRT